MKRHFSVARLVGLLCDPTKLSVTLVADQQTLATGGENLGRMLEKPLGLEGEG